MSEQKCCPDCSWHEEVPIPGVVGLVQVKDLCKNELCLCHHPLGVKVHDDYFPKDRFGK